MDDELPLARVFWQQIECVHAITYFAPESIDAAKGAGLRGFWMGYFGFRAAPMGPVGPALIDAAFANFAPAMVRRAIPDAWAFAEPDALVAARAAAAAAVLRRVAPGVEAVADAVNPALAAVVAHADSIGRPLFAANRELEPLVDPVEQLWQHCTTLREHRGDGHVAALVAAGLDGCKAHFLLAAEQDVPPEVFFEHRGWNADQQAAARADLVAAGLLGENGGITEAGRSLRREVEAVTDRLAVEPLLRAHDDAGVDRMIAGLSSLADAVLMADVLPFPNPMGLLRPRSAR